MDAATIASIRARGLRRRSGRPMNTWPAPHRIEMTASAMKAPAVRPAATCAPLLSDAASDAAPMPSANVDTPTMAVSAPQTTKRMATKSTCVVILRLRLESHERRLDGDADVHAHRAGVRRGDAKTERGAVGHARRDRDVDGVVKQRFA